MSSSNLIMVAPDDFAAMQATQTRWGAELVAWAYEFLAMGGEEPISAAEIDAVLQDTCMGFFSNEDAAGRAMMEYRNPELYAALKVEEADRYFDFPRYFEKGLDTFEFTQVSLSAKGGFWIFNPNL